MKLLLGMDRGELRGQSGVNEHFKDRVFFDYEKTIFSQSALFFIMVFFIFLREFLIKNFHVTDFYLPGELNIPKP